LVASSENEVGQGHHVLSWKRKAEKKTKKRRQEMVWSSQKNQTLECGAATSKAPAMGFPQT
jgi:hypothetical protein